MRPNHPLERQLSSKSIGGSGSVAAMAIWYPRVTPPNPNTLVDCGAVRF